MSFYQVIVRGTAPETRGVNKLYFYATKEEAMKAVDALRRKYGEGVAHEVLSGSGKG